MRAYGYSEEFRKTFKKENPNVKAVSAVSTSYKGYIIHDLLLLFFSSYKFGFAHIGWESWWREMEIIECSCKYK